jgi:hypothetical protein
MLIRKDYKELCQSKLEIQYINKKIKNTVGIITASAPDEFIPDKCSLIAFALLSIEDYRSYIGLPVYFEDDGNDKIDSSYYPDRVGHITTLCALDKKTKIINEYDVVEELSMGLGTTLQYLGCLIYKNIYGLDYMVGESASLPLLYHYVKIGFIYLLTSP